MLHQAKDVCSIAPTVLEELLAEELEDEGEKAKESPAGERNAVAPHRSQLKDQAAASSEEINLLTSAILGLTKSLPLLNPPLGGAAGKGKRPASKPPNAAPAKKAKVNDGEAGSSMTASDQSTDCEMLYHSVLNNGNDEIPLSELVKEYKSDDTVGESLENEKLAKLVDKMFRCKLSEKNLKDRLDRQERPANCTTAKPPRVNPGIWQRLREPTKNRDIQFYKIQQALTKGILPVVRITDKLRQAKSINALECQDLKKLGLEALSLLTHASYENLQGRLLLRPDIGKEYSALCSSQLPFTDFLFGDDLQKHLKDIGDQNKIGAKITPNYKGERSFPRRPGNNSSKQSKKLERPQLQTLEIQKQCQPIQENPDKPIEHLLPATSTVSICSPPCNNVYIAGNIARHFSVWQTLTSDPYIFKHCSGLSTRVLQPTLPGTSP